MKTISPFTMYVQSLRITDGTTNSSSYSYGDHSGKGSSIKVAMGESDAYKAIHRVTTAQKAAQTWANLSTGAKIGIAAAVLSVLAIGLIAFTFYCISQRKKGRAEKLANDKQWEKEENELMEYRAMMAKGHFAVSRQSVMMDGPKGRYGPVAGGNVDGFQQPGGLAPQKPQVSRFSRFSGGRF